MAAKLRHMSVFLLIGFFLFLQLGCISGRSTGYPNANWNIELSDVFVLKYEFSSGAVFYTKVWPNTIYDDRIEGGFEQYFCSNGTLQEGTMTWAFTRTVQQIADMNASDAWTNQTVTVANRSVDIFVGQGPALLGKFTGDSTQWFTRDKGLLVKETHTDYSITLVSWANEDLRTFAQSQCPAASNTASNPFEGISGFTGAGMALLSALGMALLFMRAKSIRAPHN